MTHAQNLRNWAEVFEVSDNFIAKIKQHLKDNLSNEFDYSVENSNYYDKKDYLLLTAFTIKITNKKDSKQAKTFKYDLGWLGSVLQDESLDDGYEDLKIQTLTNKNKEDILKKYDDLFNKITKLDLETITNKLIQDANNGIVYLDNSIRFFKGDFIFKSVPVNEATMILKDNVLYFLKDNQKNNDLKTLDYLDLNEFNKDNITILPTLERIESTSYSKKDQYNLSYSKYNDYILVNNAENKFFIHVPMLEGWVFDNDTLGNPNVNDKYVEYYLKDENKNNKKIIREMNTQQTDSYGSFYRQYPSLNKEAFLDILNILNWRRAISLREWQLDKLDVDAFNDLPNNPVKSFSKKVQEIISKYKDLADTDYREINYKDILKEFENNKIKINEDKKDNEVVVEIKEKQAQTKAK